ncbi:MAG TPA: penicillin acylase family protein [Anaeromyxobacteraceae bacterium]|nr:penicillin acylase family protein [Anaeromyxobacteraceae bacterium]
MIRSGAPALVAALALLLACSSSSPGRFDSVPVTTRVTTVPGLSAEVNVVYDGLGVPHIYAASDGDAAYALGWAHARDRLFQMDFLRRFARGTLAEYVAGPQIVALDVQNRTLMTARTPAATGTHHVEDHISAGLSAETRTWAERYRDGVNRWLDDLRADVKAGKRSLPTVYAGLAVGPDAITAWSVEDSIAIGRLQTLQLSLTLSDELAAGQLAATLAASQPALFADLTRHAPIVPNTILAPAPSPGALARLTRGAPAAHPAHLAAAAGSLAGARAFLDGLPRLMERGDRAGSNNWSLSAARSATGNALVANDPHLSLAKPANFHMVHIDTPSRHVAGVAFPGTPAVVIGHNDRIAWGNTVVGYDVTDVYVEQLDAGNQSVAFNGAQVPIQQVTESHRVRQQDGSVVDQPYPIALVPHHGPVLPGSLDPAAHTALSVRWTGHDPTFEVQAFLDVNKARSVDEAVAAYTAFRVGAQNFNVADVEGHIAYSPHADVPVRAGGDATKLRTVCQPWLPLPGDGTCEWTGKISDSDLPQAKDPAAGFIATANNDVTGALLDDDPVGGDPAPGGANRPYLYAFTDVGLREKRIQDVLSQPRSFALDDLTALQADTRSELGALMTPGLVALLETKRATLSAQAQAALDVLKGWQFSTPTGLDAQGNVTPSAESQASSIFHAFQRRFADRVLRPGLGANLDALPSEQIFKILVKLANPGAPGPALKTGTALCGASCADAAAAALEDTVAFLGGRLGLPVNWSWGRLHQVKFTFLGSSDLDRLTGGLFSVGPFPNDGGLFTVDVANFGLFGDDFLQTAGPNVRFSAELDPAGVKWRAVIPGGQVDALGDPHENDQIPPWLANAKGDQPFAVDAVVAQGKSRVVFTP